MNTAIQAMSVVRRVFYEHSVSYVFVCAKYELTFEILHRIELVEVVEVRVNDAIFTGRHQFHGFKMADQIDHTVMSAQVDIHCKYQGRWTTDAIFTV